MTITPEPLLKQPAFTPTRKMRVVNADVGGTWFENTYPGAACDIPSHSYIFPFEGNPDWSKFYVDQKEIQAYIKRTAEKYDLGKHVQLNTTIRETVWDEGSAKWSIKLEQAGELKEDEPDIKGLHDFKGKLLHSARWDNSYQWEGKKAAVIGNGASGIQLVATMQPKVEKLVNYIRQPTWISVNFLGDKTPEGVNFTYSEEQKRTWREDPNANYLYRKDLEQSLNGFFFAMCLDHPAQAIFQGYYKDRMHASLVNAPDLEKRILPSFKAGCRRITPGDGYLEALHEPNCRDCWDPIERITEKGIKTAAGEEEFDLIICATGFDSSWLPQWKLVENLPNYGMINGPNPAISHGSVLQQMSWTGDYLLRWIMRMNRHDIRTLAVKKEAVEDYNQYAQEFLKLTVWLGECRTLYKNGRSVGKVTGLYPGSLVHYQRALEEVGGEHFDMTWRSRNRFRCLGNGTVETDKDGAGDLAPYFSKYSPFSN
ncbi:hypothetical protein NCS52_01116100 [Fusarium sp. LHS14.1]|nr:hypothetical protein NCS52_01116100 [Fusarium sp. LHS14.1]